MTGPDLIAPERKELFLGFGYLPVQRLLLPVLLLWINRLLPVPLDAGVLNCVMFLISFLAVLVIFRRFLHRSFCHACKIGNTVARHALRGLGMYFLANIAVSWLILIVDPDFVNVNNDTVSGFLKQHYAIMAVCTVMLVPLTEEVLFRGIFFAGLYRRSPFMAYAVSSLAFSAIHVVGYLTQHSPLTLLLCFAQYIPAGLVLGYAYRKTGNILTPIAIHMSVNLIATLLMR